MIEVELPDGSIAEFPDGTAPDVIKGALRKRYAGQQSANAMADMSAATQRFNAEPDEVRRNMPDGRDSVLGKVDTAVRGLAGMLSLDTADEIAAGLGTGFGYLGDYDKELQRQRGIDTADAENRPGYRIAGQVVGALTGGAGLAKSGLSLTGRAMDAGFKLPMVAGASAVEGGALGAASGFGSGENGVGDRVEQALKGGGIGLGTGFVAPVIGAGLSKAATKVLNSLSLRDAAKGAPTRAELKAITDELYGTMRNAGITYDADAFAGAVQAAKDQMNKEGLRTSVAGNAYAYLDDLVKPGSAPDFDDINGIVQTVGGAQRSAASSKDPNAGALAKAYGIIRDHLDDFEMNAPLTSKAGVDRGELNAIRQAARKTALKNIKGRTLDSIMDNAETYQSGVESGIRNQISNLLRSKRGQQMFTGPERTALLQVAQGRKALQSLSKFGFDLTSLGGNATLIPALGAGLTGAGFGAPAGAALAAAGTVAKVMSPKMTQAALQQTAAAIRAGRLNAKTVMEQLPLQERKLLNSMLNVSGASAAGRL